MTAVSTSPPKKKSAAASGLRHALPVLLGLALFGLGVFALYRLLKPVHAADVIAQIRATPFSALITAFGATFLGYVALIGYDWSALRYLGKKVPFRIVAVGGFLGYSFGNTIGVSVVSGGAVRYRIYSAFGLSAFEVASVSTFVALAFGFGITVIGLFALALHPYALEGVIPFSPQTLRPWALGGALGLTGLLTWLSVSGKTLRWRRFEVSAPSPGTLYGQLGFTLVDTAMAALTLYVLLPPGAPDFITFLALFATAAMAGVLSHVPGGVGVFEAVVIAAMPADVPLDQVAAALLLYRVIYYLVPFALAFAFVALNEARLAGGAITRLFGEVPEPMQPMLRSVASSAPALTGLTAFGLGIYLILMALMPSVRPEEIDPNDLLATVLLEGGAILSAALGVLLVILSRGLARRISGGFWLTLAALVTGALASLLNGLDFESAALLIAAAVILWPFRREFYRSGKLTRGVFSPAWIILVSGIILGAGAFFFFMHQATPYTNSLWTEFSGAANTPRSLRAGLVASALLLFTTVFLATQPSRARTRAPDADALEKAARIIGDQDNPQACLALSGDKALFFGDEEDAFIMYGARGKSWIAYGDPVGNQASVPAMAWAFFEDAYEHAYHPIFYDVGENYLPLWVEMGFSLQKIGEEAVVDLAGFDLGNDDLSDIRQTHARAAGSGLSLRMMTPPHDDALIGQLREVSDSWLAGASGREKGFAVGQMDAEYLSHFPLAVVEKEGRIVAFANILRPAQGDNVAVDLLRYLPDQAEGMIEFIMVELIAHYKTAGARRFSLGLAPLVGTETRRGARLWNRFGALIFRHGGAFHDFKGLRAFKDQFRPRWQARYIAVPDGVSPLVAMKDVALLIAGGPASATPK